MGRGRLEGVSARDHPGGAFAVERSVPLELRLVVALERLHPVGKVLDEKEVAEPQVRVPSRPNFAAACIVSFAYLMG
jgi:hypothetical protein